MDVLPVPPSATPLTADVEVLPLAFVWVTFRKLWAGVPKKELVNAPPVAGSTAMVQPDSPAAKHIVALAAGGIVVLMTRAPPSSTGLKIACSYTTGTPFWGSIFAMHGPTADGSAASV